MSSITATHAVEADEDAAAAERDRADSLESRSCADCGAERVGPFCHECGQRFVDERLTFRVLWREFARRFFRIEEGLWLTFREMFTDPGGVARRYVDGRRARYTNPLAYFMLSATVALLSFRLMSDWMTGVLSRQFSSQFDAEVLALVEAAYGAGGVEAMTEYYIDVIHASYSYMMLLMCIPCALALRLFHGSRHTVAETTIFSLYVIGHAVLFSILFQPITYLVYDASANPQVWSLVLVGAMGIGYAAYGAYASGSFFGRARSSTVLTGVAVLSGYVVWFVLFTVAVTAILVVPMVLAAL